MSILDAEFFKLVEVFLSFNALGDHFSVQVFRDLEGAAKRTLQMKVLGDSADIFFIKLDHIRLEKNETFQAGVAEPHIIDMP